MNSVAAAPNPNATVRRGLIANGAILRMYWRLQNDIASLPKVLPPGINIRVRLYKAAASFALLSTAAGLNYKIKIVDAALHLQRMKLEPKFLVSFKKAMQVPGRFLNLNIMSHSCLPNTITAGTQLVDRLLIGNGPLPVHMTVVMLNESAVQGALTENVVNFKHFDLENFKLKVNDRQVPSIEYNTNFTAGASNLERLYYDIFQHTSAAAHGVTKAMLRGGYLMLNFPLEIYSYSCSFTSPRRWGTLRLHASFRVPLPQNIVILCYPIYAKTISIAGDLSTVTVEHDADQ